MPRPIAYDPANPRRYLDFEEQEDLARMLTVCAELKDQLKPNQQSFIEDMVVRLASHGEDLIVSQKQWNWLEAIYNGTSRS